MKWLPRQRWTRFILIAAVALTIGMICDWARPPREQLSVILYQKIVLGGYRTMMKPVSDRFIRCRFQPTCSLYSEGAMLAYGFPKGLWLTVVRLSRCMPWVPEGTKDPVPAPAKG